jgi:hypothetical protein
MSYTTMTTRPTATPPVIIIQSMIFTAATRHHDY